MTNFNAMASYGVGFIDSGKVGQEGGSVPGVAQDRWGSLLPCSVPLLSSNVLDDLQLDLTILLESILTHPSPYPTNLVIMPGMKAWMAKLDVVIFVDRGNIVDCFMLACWAVLWDTKVPHTKQIEYRAPRRHPTQGDVTMDADGNRDRRKGWTQGKGAEQSNQFRAD